MKINIVAVGKIKEKYWTDAINEYKKRLSRFCDFNIIEVDEYKNNKTTSEQINITKKCRGRKATRKGKRLSYCTR